VAKLPAGTLSKVPEVTLGFWVIKVLATTLGETGGDAVTMSMNLGYAIGSFIFIGIFAAAVVAQILAKSFHPFLYWATIVATTTLGTTMADFPDRSLGIGYFGGSSILFGGADCFLGRMALVRGLHLRQHRRNTPGRDVLLGNDPVLADAWHGTGRLDGRHERAWLLRPVRSSSLPVWRLSPLHIFGRKSRTPCCFGRHSFSRDRLAQRSGTCWTNRTSMAAWRSAAISPQPFSQRLLSSSSSSSRKGRACVRALTSRRCKAANICACINQEFWMPSRSLALGSRRFRNERQRNTRTRHRQDPRVHSALAAKGYW
jgi:Repeat of Unknown Function (DUF347)